MSAGMDERRSGLVIGDRREPQRVLMSLDGVGGVWRYAMDLAAGLRAHGIETVFAVFGPQPDPVQLAEAERIGIVEWTEAPLDWLVDDEHQLDGTGQVIADLARTHQADIVHLNLPSQAAGLWLEQPIVVVSHSCVVSWFRAVRGGDVPADWQWQERLNRSGFEAADRIIAPSASHAALLRECYGGIGEIAVVHNAVVPQPAGAHDQPLAFAAGRWWDDGKNGAILDRAAALTRLPIEVAGAMAGPNGQVFTPQHMTPLGEIFNGEVRRRMGEAAVFVSPSLYEPFGLSALEAAHAGAALILADIPTYRELWDGAAHFFDPHDADDLARALDDLGDNDAECERLGQAARQRASRFSREAQAAAISEIYAAAARGRANSQRKAG